MGLRILVCLTLIYSYIVSCALEDESFQHLSLENFDPELVSKIQSVENGKEALLILRMFKLLGDEGPVPTIEPSEGEPYRWVAGLMDRFVELQEKGTWNDIKKVLLEEEMESRKEMGTADLTDEEYYEWAKGLIDEHREKMADMEAKVLSLEEEMKTAEQKDAGLGAGFLEWIKTRVDKSKRSIADLEAKVDFLTKIKLGNDESETFLASKLTKKKLPEDEINTSKKVDELVSKEEL